MANNEFYELTLHITGRVQGVNFRRFVCDKARELGLKGWVRNEPDEITVTVVAEGDQDTLKELRDWCNLGPRWAHVAKVEEGWKELEKPLYTDFRIAY